MNQRDYTGFSYPRFNATNTERSKLLSHEPRRIVQAIVELWIFVEMAPPGGCLGL